MDEESGLSSSIAWRAFVMEVDVFGLIIRRRSGFDFGGDIAVVGGGRGRFRRVMG